MVHLVNVKPQKLAGDFPTELKGTHQKVTQRGINWLAKKLTARIEQLSDSASTTAP